MSFITGKHLPRRTFLRGAGATVALPLLDAMLPSGKRWNAAAAAAGIDRPRLVAIEIVHGSAGSSDFGIANNLFAPAKVGRDFDLTPTSMVSLEDYKDHLTIISNTDVRMAEAYDPHEIGGDDFRSSAVFLTQAHPKQTMGSDVYVGTSLDQLYAQRFGQDTPIPSMQLCIENIDQSGGCAYGYTCLYTDSISWTSPTEPLPVIRDPRVAFDTLFGAGATADERKSRMRTNASILDWITGRIGELSRGLGAADKQRLDNYLDNIREVERRIQIVETRNASGEQRELPGAPAGVPDHFGDHMHLMWDLQALAFQSDMTRVFSLKMGRDSSARVFPDAGTDASFHPASHFGSAPEKILDFHKINRYHISMLPYFLEKLKNIQEGDSNLLDKTMIIYGSPMGNANLHNHRRNPLLLLGGAGGQLRGPMHLRAPDGTPMANSMLTMMHMLGLDDMESFGDSTGPMSFTSPVAE
ncbi:MAG: DUF1552 domain-containing protein [Gemmatimonadetes bacterium]|nr:DUF1552 domain-containing protein [Gemmatimonadota bacterium]